MANSSDDAVRAIVMEHVAAFNAHDRPRLFAGLTPDVAWSTGVDAFYGLEVLERVFEAGLWAMQPSLTVVDLLVDGDRAAVQMTEVLTIEGEQRRFAIACFFTVRAGRIQKVQVFREGSADID